MQRQHDTVLGLVAELKKRVTRIVDAPDRAEAYQVTLLQAKLAGILRIHLAQEDGLLYPALMACEKGEVARVAHAFSNEMGQIGAVFTAYSERWRATEAILNAPVAFARESEALFTALGDRITRENDQLYPLADSLDEPEMAARVA